MVSSGDQMFSFSPFSRCPLGVSAIFRDGVVCLPSSSQLSTPPPIWGREMSCDTPCDV